MGYCAVGSISIAEWNKIKSMCSEMRKYIDEKLKNLDDVTIDGLRTRISTLETKMAAVEVSQETQDRRLDSLEAGSANTEITTNEVISIYEGV